MGTKEKRKFPTVRLAEEAYKLALKVARKRKESLSHYISSLILSK